MTFGRSSKPSDGGTQLSAFAVEILVRRAKDPNLNLAAEFSNELAALAKALASPNRLVRAQACVLCCLGGVKRVSASAFGRPARTRMYFFVETTSCRFV